MTRIVDWDDYPNFSREEFTCKETGENRMQKEFLELLQMIRETFGRPMNISSGYRSRRHSVELVKDRPGAHTKGVAADIKVSGKNALDLINIAYAYGIRRIGVKQTGGEYTRFIHLDIADRTDNFPQGVWSY